METSNENPKKILVVEDEDMLRDVYVDMLQKSGYQVFAAPDGGQAIEQLRTNTFDLVLLDIVLPNASGLDVLSAIDQEQLRTPASKVLVLTNISDAPTIGETVGKGVAGYLVKTDTTPDKLLQRVQEFFEST